jgi:hypothetical protein
LAEPAYAQRIVKKSKSHPDDVRIGNDEWIYFVEIVGGTEKANSLDAFFHPMESFWRLLEVNCVSECCGIYAHSFLPQDIWNAVRKCGDAKLKEKLMKLREHFDGISNDCVYSTVLNQYFDRIMFSKLLDHVIATVNRM